MQSTMQRLIKSYLTLFLFVLIFMPGIREAGAVVDPNAPVHPTRQSVDFYGEATIDGDPVAVDSIVLAFAPDPLQNFLLNTGLGFESDLDNRFFSQALRDEFEIKGITLSQNVTVSIEIAGSQWLIIDRDMDQLYRIRKQGTKLQIFDAIATLAGKFTVRIEGFYGFHHVYGDDTSPSSTLDEGADPLDVITFYIEDVNTGTIFLATPRDPMTQARVAPMWTEDGKRVNVNLDASTPIDITPPPAGSAPGTPIVVRKATPFGDFLMEIPPQAIPDGSIPQVLIRVVDRDALATQGFNINRIVGRGLDIQVFTATGNAVGMFSPPIRIVVPLDPSASPPPDTIFISASPPTSTPTGWIPLPTEDVFDSAGTLIALKTNAIDSFSIVAVGPNAAPFADDQSVTTDEDTPISITPTGSDPDGDPLTFSVVSGPSNGALSGTVPNVTYTPNENFNGSDSFTFVANDGTVDSPVATVGITINPVNDPPVASAGGNQTVACNSHDGASVGLNGTSSFDPEGGALAYNWQLGSTVIATGPAATITLPVGIHGISLAVSDPEGLTSLASVQVRVFDNAPPTITAENATVECTGPEGAAIDLNALVTVADLCDPNPEVTFNPSPPAFPLGPTTVTVGARDSSNNTASATFTVTVVNTTPPEITIVDPQPVECTGPDGAAVDLNALVTVADLCDPNPQVVFNPNLSTFPLGDTTVTVDARDSSNNTAPSTTFTVTVVDTTPPEITVVDPQPVECTGPDGAAIDLNALVTVADLCDPNPAVIFDPHPPAFPLGDTTVTVEATDASDNTATATFTVTVVDTTPPEFGPPEFPDVIVEWTAGADLSAFQSVDLIEPNVRDICTPADELNISNDAPAGGFPRGETTVTWTVEDSAGNSATAVQLVNLIDTRPPEFDPPGLPEIVLEWEAGVDLNALQLVDLIEPQVIDACDPRENLILDNDAPAGGFPRGETIVTWTVEDSSGNSATAAQLVNLVDTTSPDFDPPDLPDVVVEWTEGDDPNARQLVDLPPPTVVDACDPAANLTLGNDAPAAGFPLGETIVTWTVEDSSGNSATAAQFVNLIDTRPPEFDPAGLPDVVVEWTAGPDPNARQLVDLPTPLVPPGVTLSHDAPVGGFPRGETILTWTAVDRAGNTAEATQTVNLIDTTPPEFDPPDLPEIVVEWEAGVDLNALQFVDLIEPQVIDTCDPRENLILDNDAPGDCFPRGETIVTWIVEDSSGNNTTATQSVNLVDTTPPIILSPTEALELVADDPNGLPASVIDVAVEDLCDPDPRVIITPEFLPLGTNPVTITAIDGSNNEASVTIDVTVLSGDLPPDAFDQAVGTNEGTAVSFTLEAVDPEGGPVTFDVTAGPQSGTLDGTPPDLTYTPDAGFTGVDFIEFTATDDSGLTSEMATVAVQVTPLGTPFAEPQRVEVDEDAAVDITLTGQDPDEDVLTFAPDTFPTHGTLSGDVPNLTYTPDPNYFGPDGFTFTVDDGTSTSPPAPVEIEVLPVNDLPQAQPVDVDTDEDTSVDILLGGRDLDGPQDLQFDLVEPPLHGELSLPQSARAQEPDLQTFTQTVTYTPGENFFGQDRFTYIVHDGEGDSDPATVRILVRPINDPPEGEDIDITTEENTGANQPVPITLHATDVDDPPGDLSYTVTDPANGRLIGNPPFVGYIPEVGFNGTDTFSYSANDGELDSDTATVTIEVTPVNTPPRADSQRVDTLEDTPVTITLTGGDDDAGDVLSLVPLDLPRHGTVDFAQLSRATSQQDVPSNLFSADVVYTPDENYFGPDGFRFAISDGRLESDPAAVLINVQPQNDPPTAEDQDVSVEEDTGVLITLSGDDVDGDSIIFTVTSEPTNGALAGTAPSLFYQPPPNFFGDDSFTFVTNDGTEDSLEATVSIIVTPVNDRPFAVGDRVATNEDESVEIALQGGDLDVDDTLAVEIVEGPSNGTLEPLQAARALSQQEPEATTVATVRYTPEPDFFGLDRFTFFVDDGTGEPNDHSNLATIFIGVAPANDPPVAEAGESITTSERSVVTLDGGGSFDPDDPLLVLNYTWTGPSDIPLANADTAAPFFEAPEVNGETTLTFELIVNDGELDSPPDAVDVIVTGVNRPPSIDAPASVNAPFGDELQVTVIGRDEDDGDVLSLDAINLPPGAAFEPVQPARQLAQVVEVAHVLRWTPTPDQADARFEVELSVTDGQETVRQILVIEVTPNSPPRFDPIEPVQTVDERAEITFTVTASDPDPTDQLTRTAFGLPTGSNLTPGGVFNWTPTPEQIGDHQVTFSVEDQGGLFDEITVTIIVENVNDHPELAMEPPQISVEEGEVFIFTARAFDPDPTNDVLNIFLDGLDELPGQVEIDDTGTQFVGSTGREITVRVATDSDSAGSYGVRGRAEDQFGSGSDEANVFIRVGDVNHPPIPEPLEDQTIFEGESISGAAAATDPDEGDESRTRLVSGLPRGATFADGLFEWTPDFRQGAPDPGQQYTFRFSATDGKSAPVFFEGNVFVLDVNQPPTIASIPEDTITETESRVIPLVAVDPDPGDLPNLQIDVDGAPPGTFIEGRTLVIPALGRDGVGDYLITVTVIDGKPNGIAQTAFNFVVTAVNRRPEIIGIEGLGDDGQVDVAQTEFVSIGVDAIDPDLDDTLTFEASGLPAGLTIDPPSGTISGQTDFDAGGIYDVSVRVTDSATPPLSDIKSFGLRVDDRNRDPIISVSGIGDGDTLTVNEAETPPATFDVSVSDEDGRVNPLRYFGPPFGGIRRASAFRNQLPPVELLPVEELYVLVFNPGFRQADVYPVTLEGTDSNGGSVEFNFTLVVNRGNRDPSILSPVSSRTELFPYSD